MHLMVCVCVGLIRGLSRTQALLFLRGSLGKCNGVIGKALNVKCLADNQNKTAAVFDLKTNRFLQAA